jgi:prepilin-type N-terminal cleavage/methylation domain-containing protein
VKTEGMTLVELLVAMVLISWMGLWASSGLMAHQRAKASITQWARVAENGRMAQTLLHERLMSAQARLPCGRQVSSLPRPVQLLSDPIFRREQLVMGWEAQGTGTNTPWSLDPVSKAAWRHEPQLITQRLLGYLNDRVDPQSDVLVIYGLETLSDLSIETLGVDGVLTERHHSLKSCSWMVISDCSVDLEFQQSSTDPRMIGWNGMACQPGNEIVMPSVWEDASPTELAVHHRFIDVWFVGPHQSGHRSLYRTRWAHGWLLPQKEEVVSHIDSLQLEYGIGTVGGALRWVVASEVSSWSDVLGVRFAVLASVDPTGVGLTQSHLPQNLWQGSVTWSDPRHSGAVFGSAVFFRVAMVSR